MVNSRSKGKRGELEARDLLIRCGVSARRGQQFSGSPESPDLMTGLDWVHWEVKRTESLSLYPAIAQAERDSAVIQVPIVLHRRSGHRWLAIVDAERLIGLLIRLERENRCKIGRADCRSGEASGNIL